MRIALFVTCLADALFPQVGQATVAVLERLGHEVVFPEARPAAARCTSTPATSARRCRWCAATSRLRAGYDVVVAPSGSCVGSVRHQHAMVARRAGDAGAGRAGARRRRAHLRAVRAAGRRARASTDVGAYFPHRVTYHPTCHSLRMLRVGDKPLRLLRAVRGIDLVELPDADQCCGFGGTFALKNADTSTAMLADKMRHVLGTGAEVVTAGDASCLMHIGGGLSRLRTGIRTLHLAEILASTEDAPGGRARR